MSDGPGARRAVADPPTAPIAVVSLDVRGTVLAYDTGAQSMFGWTPEEVIGRSVTMLAPEAVFEPSPDGPRLVATGKPLVARRADGTPLPVQGTTSTFEVDGRVVHTVVVRDLTPLQSADDALRATEATFRMLVEGVADHAIFMVGPDGSIISWNAGAERLFGFSAAQVVGHKVALLHTPASRDANEMLAEAADRGVAEEEGPRRRADGSEFTASVVITPIHNPDGSLRGFAKSLRDITERHAAEAAAEVMATQLRQRQRLEAVGQLAGGVAHDFNNLLTVISATAALPLPDAVGDNPAAQLDIQMIADAAARGASLTRQLLTFSRQQVVTPEVLDVGAVVRGIELLLQRTIGEHIELAVRSAPDRWPVLADRGQLEQVVVNLAVNARDAMAAGGRLTVDVDSVDLDVDDLVGAGLSPGRYVRMTVADTGTGMPPEVVARAFEPFFTTKPYGQGTGLGLATVYGIVTAAGGLVRIASQPGEGTSVTCFLPATSQGADRPAVPAPAAAVPPGDLTILVVEDEAGVRESTRRLLVRAGFTVLTAHDGAAGLAVVQDPSQRIDLLLTDLVMPGLSGRDLAERAKAERPGLAVLFMSGYTAGILDVPDVDALGGFLEKPFTPAVLLRAVAHAMAEARTASTPGT